MRWRTHTNGASPERCMLAIERLETKNSPMTTCCQRSRRVRTQDDSVIVAPPAWHQVLRAHASRWAWHSSRTYALAAATPSVAHVLSCCRAVAPHARITRNLPPHPPRVSPPQCVQEVNARERFVPPFSGTRNMRRVLQTDTLATWHSAMNAPPALPLMILSSRSMASCSLPADAFDVYDTYLPGTLQNLEAGRCSSPQQKSMSSCFH